MSVTSTAASTDLRFPRQRRLLKSESFTRVFREGTRSADQFFTLLAIPNQIGHARLGMAISRKLAGSAVERNRIRRQIREQFRLNQHDLPAIDIVAMARRDTVASDPGALQASLGKHWKRLTKRCAASS